MLKKFFCNHTEDIKEKEIVRITGKPYHAYNWNEDEFDDVMFMIEQELEKYIENAYIDSEGYLFCNLKIGWFKKYFLLYRDIEDNYGERFIIFFESKQELIDYITENYKDLLDIKALQKFLEKDYSKYETVEIW
jgi:hypothetical protein